MIFKNISFLFYTWVLGYDYTIDRTRVHTSKKGDVITFSANNIYKIVKVDKKSNILYMKKILK